MDSRRSATRSLIRTGEQLTKRLGRALRADDPKRTLHALLALRAFVEEGLSSYCAEDVCECEPYAAAADDSGESIAVVGRVS